VAWMWPLARGHIQTSVQAGGMASARMRSRTLLSRITTPC